MDNRQPRYEDVGTFAPAPLPHTFSTAHHVAYASDEDKYKTSSTGIVSPSWKT